MVKIGAYSDAQVSAAQAVTFGIRSRAGQYAAAERGAA
jgi:hypothetical protein